MLDRVTNWLKTLGDTNRLRLLMMLMEGDYCVCELTEMLDLPQPMVSKHLTKLKDLGLVEAVRESRFVVYRLKTDDETALDLLATIRTMTRDDPVLLADKRRGCTCMASVRRAQS